MATLRSRLVAALVVLTATGLVVFGVTTYALYLHSLRSRLDDQLRGAIQPIGGRLATEVWDAPRVAERDLAVPERPDADSEAVGGFGFDTFAALIGSDGEVISSVNPSVTTSRPALPDDLAELDEPTLFTVDSRNGSGGWRVLVQPIEPPAGLSPDVALPDELDGAVVVVAASTAEISTQMNRLLTIEVGAAAALLSALAAGAWLILRRGLRPLESMADAARTISEGDLTHRVEPADGRTEVGQLGLALNIMLDRIEASFDRQVATEARLRQFLSDASHELRTPITSIQGFAELFRLDHEHRDLDLPVILRRIEDEAARMGVLVEDLLLLARLGETRPFAPETVDLAVLAADACSDTIATAPDRSVSLDAPNPVLVSGDGAHLRQAFANLMANAVRHTPGGSPIEVSVQARSHRAVVEIRDHGPGVPASARPHIFDRFWQADPARVGPGNGLGLAIVATIAEEHSGTVTVEDADGGGALFRLDLPRIPVRPGGAGSRPST